MKKTITLAFALASFYCAEAQVLNQSAGWPNTAWSVTGTYNDDPLAFESSPLTTGSFAFDDDDAGGSHEDNIAAESPVIDLTAAFDANERKLEITVDYGYRYLAEDLLQFQYWDADNAAWVAWPGETIPGVETSVTDDFCTITKVTYHSTTLEISNFSATQLSGFKYRISYDDNPEGTDWNYGFCFNSPTIKSVGCEAPFGLAMGTVTPMSADISWASIAGVEGFEYVLDNSDANPESGAAITTNDFSTANLTPETVYYFHVRTNCGGSYSEWRSISFTTPPMPPANDSCETAIAIASFPYTNTQDASAATNNGGFITGCGSGMNDGVWYTFTGDGGDITVTVENVGDWDPELGIFTGVCGQFECVDEKDSSGTGSDETYTVTASSVGTTYFVNVGHYNSSSDNPEGPFTLSVSSTILANPSFDASELNAYPNPIENTLNLSYQNAISEVSVFNVLGQQVLAKQVNANEAQIDFSTLSQGAYFVKIVSGQTAKTIKVIKQ